MPFKVSPPVASTLTRKQDTARELSLLAELRKRLCLCWQQKLWLTVGICAVFWPIYSLLSWHAVFPFRSVPQTSLDKIVGFSQQPWGWIYLSQYLYVVTIPWLMSTRTEALRYVAGLTLMCGVSFMIFFFCPVRGPRPESFGTGLAFALIARFDGGLNTFPSLHAGFMTYTFALGWRLFRQRLWGSVACGFLLWGCLILYSTLAVKQHYVWDLVAGGLIGLISDWFAWRGSGSCRVASTMLCRSGEISQLGKR